MSNIFVSDASGDDSDDGSTEALAKLTLAGALVIAIGGDLIWMKVDGVYSVTAATTISIDDITIVAYDTWGSWTQPWESDLSEGGVNYKTDWATLESDGGAFSTIIISSGVELIRFFNIKIIGTPTTQEPIQIDGGVEVEGGIRLYNCWIDGGLFIELRSQTSLVIIDCQITGAWDITSPTGFDGCFSHIATGFVGYNYFNISSGNGYISTALNFANLDSSGIAVCYNIFTCGATASLDKEMIRTHHGGQFYNNTFYLPSGAELGVGSYQPPMGDFNDFNAFLSLIQVGSTFAEAWNNIFVNKNLSNKPEGILDHQNKASYTKYNCYQDTVAENSESAPRGNTDIVGSALLSDPANGDFRLRPSSPCLNTGKPTIGGQSILLNGFSSMGAWQRKSILS